MAATAEENRCAVLIPGETVNCTHEIREGRVVTVINAGGIAGGCSLCREDRLRRWYAELHYAVRKDANILDHKLTEQEAHDQAVARAKRMHAELEAFHLLASPTKGSAK